MFRFARLVPVWLRNSLLGRPLFSLRGQAESATPQAKAGPQLEGLDVETVGAEHAEQRSIPGLDLLPVLDREVIVLRFGQGLSEMEAGAALGLSPRQVRRATLRAIALLARQ